MLENSMVIGMINHLPEFSHSLDQEQAYR